MKIHIQFENFDMAKCAEYQGMLVQFMEENSVSSGYVYEAFKVAFTNGFSKDIFGKICDRTYGNTFLGHGFDITNRRIDVISDTPPESDAALENSIYLTYKLGQIFQTKADLTIVDKKIEISPLDRLSRDEEIIHAFVTQKSEEYKAA